MQLLSAYRQANSIIEVVPPEVVKALLLIYNGSSLPEDFEPFREDSILKMIFPASLIATALNHLHENHTIDTKQLWEAFCLYTLIEHHAASSPNETRHQGVNQALSSPNPLHKLKALGLLPESFEIFTSPVETADYISTTAKNRSHRSQVTAKPEQPHSELSILLACTAEHIEQYIAQAQTEQQAWLKQHATLLDLAAELRLEPTQINGLIVSIEQGTYTSATSDEHGDTYYDANEEAPRKDPNSEILEKLHEIDPSASQQVDLANLRKLYAYLTYQEAALQEAHNAKITGCWQRHDLNPNHLQTISQIYSKNPPEEAARKIGVAYPDTSAVHAFLDNIRRIEPNVPRALNIIRKWSQSRRNTLLSSALTQMLSANDIIPPECCAALLQVARKAPTAGQAASFTLGTLIISMCTKRPNAGATNIQSVLQLYDMFAYNFMQLQDAQQPELLSKLFESMLTVAGLILSGMVKSDSQLPEEQVAKIIASPSSTSPARAMMLIATQIQSLKRGKEPDPKILEILAQSSTTLVDEKPSNPTEHLVDLALKAFDALSKAKALSDLKNKNPGPIVAIKMLFDWLMPEAKLHSLDKMDATDLIARLPELYYDLSRKLSDKPGEAETATPADTSQPSTTEAPDPNLNHAFLKLVSTYLGSDWHAIWQAESIRDIFSAILGEKPDIRIEKEIWQRLGIKYADEKVSYDRMVTALTKHSTHPLDILCLLVLGITDSSALSWLLTAEKTSHPGIKRLIIALLPGKEAEVLAAESIEVAFEAGLSGIKETPNLVHTLLGRRYKISDENQAAAKLVSADIQQGKAPYGQLFTLLTNREAFDTAVTAKKEAPEAALKLPTRSLHEVGMRFVASVTGIPEATLKESPVKAAVEKMAPKLSGETVSNAITSYEPIQVATDSALAMATKFFALSTIMGTLISTLTACGAIYFVGVSVPVLHASIALVSLCLGSILVQWLCSKFIINSFKSALAHDPIDSSQLAERIASEIGISPAAEKKSAEQLIPGSRLA